MTTHVASDDERCQTNSEATTAAATGYASGVPKPRTLIDRLEGLRDEHGSYREIAKICNLSHSTVSTLVRRAKKRGDISGGSAATLTRIAEGLGLSVQWLMTGEGSKRPGDALSELLELNPETWSEPAIAAARAHRDSGARLSQVEWRRLLDRLDRALSGTPEPPKSELRESEKRG